MDAGVLKHLKELEEENRRLKQMLEDPGLEHQVTKDIAGTIGGETNFGTRIPSTRWKY
jgi:hypothetical protein